MGDTGSASVQSSSTQLTEGQKKALAAAAGFVPAAKGAIGLLSGINQQNKLNRRADSVIEANRIDVQRLNRQQLRELGALKTSMGARGVITTSGTPLMVLADQAGEAALERSILRHSGEMEAFALREQGRSAMLSGIGAGLSGVGAGLIEYKKIKTLLGGSGQESASNLKIGSELGTFNDGVMVNQQTVDGLAGPQGF